MNEEREKVYQILELGKHIKNLHHKKGFGGLLFIDLSMIKFSKLSSYIRQLDKENQALKKQLHEASLTIQEMIERDIECPSNCEKLRQLKKQFEDKTEDYKRMKDNFDSKVDVLTEIDTQQKEFIEYLENEITDTKLKWGNKLTNNGYLDIAMTVRAYEQILSKYKEITGQQGGQVDNQVGSQV